ncbi:hypothetical protein ACOZ4L_15475 (plasmid) [Haloplanus ruber]|uniref:Uncharacterized protein n=1 Tax=Haloplanus ruber TaxID=869892 RepID=A0ABD6CVI8_9EURY|nr:hypothetical protein [Haloplanus ruber]
MAGTGNQGADNERTIRIVIEIGTLAGGAHRAETERLETADTEGHRTADRPRWHEKHQSRLPTEQRSTTDPTSRRRTRDKHPKEPVDQPRRDQGRRQTGDERDETRRREDEEHYRQATKNTDRRPTTDTGS